MNKITERDLKNLDDICLHHEISRVQRKNELYDGKGYKGTQGYEDMGCYKCNGYYTDCNAYITKNIISGFKEK